MKEMNYILFPLTLFLFLLSSHCKTTIASRLQDGKEKRFLIPVFQYLEYNREKNLQLTQNFANHWKAVSSFDYFIKDKKIVEDTLRSGKLLPSTNYSIDCDFHVLATKTVLVCSVKNLENGEIISSDSIQGKNISELEKELKQLAHKLYIHREE